MTTDITDLVAGLREMHFPVMIKAETPREVDANFCMWCGREWPCEMGLLLDDRDHWREKAERLEHLHILDHSLADQWQAKKEAAEQRAERYREALEKLCNDSDVRYMACSDLPYCGGGSGEEHRPDCAVGIARAALAADSASQEKQ